MTSNATTRNGYSEITEIRTTLLRTMASKILYVDDESINLYLFETIFGQDFDIDTTESGSAALAKIQQDPAIGVLVSDMLMPGMDGLELISEAKRIKPGLPCYILSGYPDHDDVLEAVSTGQVSKFWSKPYNIGELKEEFQSRVSD